MSWVDVVQACAVALLQDRVLHASGVTAGYGKVVDWREVKSGETLLEGADAFDTARSFVAMVGTDVARCVAAGDGPDADAAFVAMADCCPERLEAELQRRPVNGLNIEVGTGLDRCRLLTPPEWGDQDPRATRWLASGGLITVLAPCGRGCCPRLST